MGEQRARQDGLFHADQDPQGNAQKYTRQNPGGTRRGLECPEERDYYPWWNPSPWHDIAIITPEVDYCNNIQAPQSQNVMAKCTCAKPGVTQNTGNAVGDWSCFKWDGVQPECVDSYWTKVNYLGNADDTV